MFDFVFPNCLFLLNLYGYIFHILHTNSYLSLSQTYVYTYVKYVFTFLLPTTNMQEVEDTVEVSVCGS